MTDFMSAEKRSALMSRVRQRNTEPERLLCSMLRHAGYGFRKNVRALPGSPDVVFARKKVAIFVDGDFWHGYRFPQWNHKLQLFWRRKIEDNRRRDQRNFAKLRRKGWRVIRVWEHEIKRYPNKTLLRVIGTLGGQARHG